MEIKRRKKLLCPDKGCKRELREDELRDLLQEKDVNAYMSYITEQCVDAIKELDWCPTPNCSYPFMKSGDSDFYCDKCC